MEFTGKLQNIRLLNDKACEELGRVVPKIKI